MNREKILVVDDDHNLLELLCIRLEDAGYEVVAAQDEDVAKSLIAEQAFDLAILDLQLVRQDGITLMQEIHVSQPDIPVIILTAYGTIESAVDAMQKGAFTYLTKPFDHRELILQAKRALENRRLASEVTLLKNMLRQRYGFDNIIARSEKMQMVLDQVSKIANTDSNVFLSGESGTGKELIAKALHLVSDRRDQPFVAINCAAIPESLLESELFGYEKGAFTGAVRQSKGLFTQADRGSIFLDEIGDMPLSVQVKFLRVLQERQFQPLGSAKTINVDTRVIVATNKDLKEEVKQGRFREDLFYRIHVIPVRLPPLRERKEDIPLLVEFFLKKFSTETGKQIKGFTPDAMRKIMIHDWPGNVRELINIIEYAVVMTQEEYITDGFILTTNDEPEEMMPLREARQNFEKEYLLNLIKITQGNVTKAAETAGKYRADIYQLFKKYGINPGDFK